MPWTTTRFERRHGGHTEPITRVSSPKRGSSESINGRARDTAAVADARKPPQGDADLDRRQKAVGVASQPGENLLPPARLLELLDP
jgi:hypothetical protein